MDLAQMTELWAQFVFEDKKIKGLEVTVEAAPGIKPAVFARQ